VQRAPQNFIQLKTSCHVIFPSGYGNAERLAYNANVWLTGASVISCINQTSEKIMAA